MANETLNQLYTSSPTTVFQSTDLMYLQRSPYGSTSDFGFTYASLQSSILPQTATANQTLVSVSNAPPVWASSLPSAVQANITTVGNITSGTWNGTAISVAKGGTGASSTFFAGSVIYSNGTIFSQDNSNFFYDSTNKRLGIGTSAPATSLNVKGAITVFNTSQNLYGGIASEINALWDFGANDDSGVRFGGYNPSFGGGFFRIDTRSGSPVMNFFVRPAGSSSPVSQAMIIDGNANSFIGLPGLTSTSTNGFVNIANCAGAPTGTPTTKSGFSPIIFDTVNNKFWIYNGSTWVGVVLS